MRRSLLDNIPRALAGKLLGLAKPTLVCVGQSLLSWLSLPLFIAILLSLLLCISISTIRPFPIARMATGVVTSTAFKLEEWLGLVPTGLPQLTDIFTPPPNCSTQWVRADGDYIISGDTRFTGYESSALPSDYNARCLPYGQTTPKYSPGICTAGQIVAKINELRFQDSVVWEGLCCDR